MKNIFFITLILIIFKYLSVFFLILKNHKKGSYILEIVCSGVLFYIFYTHNFDRVTTLYFVLAEYLISKLLILFCIILIKTFAFRLLISFAQNGFIAKFISLFLSATRKKKMLKLLRNLQKINYGPKLKQGRAGKANTTHKKTRVKFDRNGFPCFKAIYTIYLPVTYYKKSRERHFYYANKKMYSKIQKNKKVKKLFTKAEIQEFKTGNTPGKYVWHHHQKRGKLQLVNRKTHSSTQHIGGYEIWGE